METRKYEALVEKAFDFFADGKTTGELPGRFIPLVWSVESGLGYLRGYLVLEDRPQAAAELEVEEEFLPDRIPAVVVLELFPDSGRWQVAHLCLEEVSGESFPVVSRFALEAARGQTVFSHLLRGEVGDIFRSAAEYVRRGLLLWSDVALLYRLGHLIKGNRVFLLRYDGAPMFSLLDGESLSLCHNIAHTKSWPAVAGIRKLLRAGFRRLSCEDTAF